MSILLDAANTGLNALFFWRYLEFSDNSLNLPVCFKAEKMVVARAAPGENMRTLSAFSRSCVILEKYFLFGSDLATFPAARCRVLTLVRSKRVTPP